jgi:bis(5'-nucleosyl)-tetraphosphatase (symmetrical)
MSTIVIGDVHGCLEELDELLALANPHRNHRLVFLGDLVDRGPDPAGVVRRVRELGAECVMGNHDEKHIRWARHQTRAKADPTYNNPMKPLSVERAAQHEQIGEDGIAFLASLPLTIDLGNGWFASHAGAAPNRPFADQKPAVLLRCRWVDDKGAMISQAERPEGARHWAEMWSGAESLVYGHHVHGRETIHIDRHPSATCVGIDTGCCFGGRLTAYVVESGDVIQVPARREYAKLMEGDDA